MQRTDPITRIRHTINTIIDTPPPNNNHTPQFIFYC